VRENPYRLATDIWGVGFQTADELALRMGTDRNSPLRAQAAIRYVLQDFSEKGHVGYPEEGVVAAAMAATQSGRDVMVEAVEQVRAQGEVVRDSPALIQRLGDNETRRQRDENEEIAQVAPSEETWLFLKQLFLAELGVAREIRALRDGPHPMPNCNVV